MWLEMGKIRDEVLELFWRMFKRVAHLEEDIVFVCVCVREGLVCLLVC